MGALLCDLTEAEEYLDMNRRTITRHLIAGRIAGFRTGPNGKWVIPLIEIQRYVSEGPRKQHDEA